MIEQERLDYSRAKMCKRNEEFDGNFQGASNEENSNNVMKVGPFATNKVINSNNDNLTESMAIEKYEADQIYTPKNFNYIIGPSQANGFSNN